MPTLTEVASEASEVWSSPTPSSKTEESMKSHSDYGSVSESSSSSDFAEFEERGVEPLTLDDIAFQSSDYLGKSFGDHSYDPCEGGRFFQVAMAALFQKKKKSANMSHAKKLWKKAVKKIKDRGDPWEIFDIGKLKEEKATRHRFNPLTQDWVVDECLVKIDTEPFAHGAMRECFRMKKISNFSGCTDWARDSNNYVAKRYMDEDTDQDTYFQDVKLQMDAKLWGDEFNRHKPPKKVDIFAMAVIELHGRKHKPLYHIEHYIDGEYVKYNSNSGFVEEKGGCRQTPQAFSHFTFERSGHELIVVDVQGVGDLYTDPQIHTSSGLEYGDGNLGTKGMALFFHSHICNQICDSLGLTRFDLSENETNSLKKSIQQRGVLSSQTRIRHDSDVLFCETPSSVERQDFRKLFRGRSGSFGYADFEPSRTPLFSLSEDISSTLELEAEDALMFTVDEVDGEPRDGERDRERSGDTVTSVDSGVGMPCMGRKRRSRTDSNRLTVCEGGTEEMEDRMKKRLSRASRPSCVSAEVARAVAAEVEEEGEDESILGRVHLDLAIYHETCRFSAEVQDKASALFHLKASADCGNMAALVAISQLFTGRPNDILPAIDQLDLAEHLPMGGNIDNLEDVGLDYMVMAARHGDTASILYLARAFDTGLNLGNDRQQSFEQAISWYKLALEKGASDPYLIQAKMAEIHLKEDGGCYDPMRSGELYSEAAESAMENMKGKLATKYYALAEEAWAYVEE